MIKIFGHIAPDTDSTGSPLVWQWYLNSVRQKEASARLLGAPNTEARFVLERWNVEEPEIIGDIARNEDVVIVDTNNPDELPPGIHDANILEIIDHHRLQGGLSTRLPINVSIRPVACTATVMYSLMGDDAGKAPVEVKGLALSCILSDTLEFRSPTTTDEDRTLATELAADLGIDIGSYAAEMFEAKSDVSAFSDAELLKMDSKKIEIAGHPLRVSVLETTRPESIIGRQEGLVSCMETIAEEDGVEQVLFFVVDILNEQSTLFVPNEFTKSIAERSFSASVSGTSVVLPGVVSRKKQILPSLVI